MSGLEAAWLGLVALLFAIAASVSGRTRGEIGSWIWSWAVLALAGIVLQLTETWPALLVVGGFLPLLFPALQLAGAFEHVGRPVPRWLIPGFAVIATGRVLIAAFGFAAESHLAVLPFELAALGAAVVIVHRETDKAIRSPMGWLLMVGFVAIAAAEAADAVLDLSQPPPGVSWKTWLAIGIPVGICQVIVTFDRMQRQLARSLHERERALEDLEESNERFRAIAENAHDLIVEADSVDGIRYANPRLYETLGYGPEDVIGARISDLVWDASELPSRAELARRREFVFPPIRVRHADGSPRWVESSARVYRGDGKSRIVVIARDVTERRRSEEEVRSAQKLESLGLLAGGIAHDFNNLLTGILGNADVALSRLPADVPARDPVERVIESSQHAAELTRQLQAYSGTSPFEVRPVDLTQEIRSRVDLLRTSAGEHVGLEFDLADGLPAVEADPTQLAQVVLNLVMNAAEACGVGPGRVRISTGRMVIDDPPPVPATGSLSAGHYVFVAVEDTGHGIDPAIRDRLFDPFFTTRTTGRGLGLSVVHGVVKMLAGAITVDSTPGEGSVLRLLLPASDQKVQAEAPRASTPLAGGDRVLVLDDDITVLKVVRSILEEYGYEVFTAENGNRAEEIMAERDPEIGLVLIDAVMPGESSENVIGRIRAVRDDVPVILMSGYAEAEAMTRFAAGGDITDFVSKPFRSRDLVGRVRAALDGKHEGSA